MTAFKIRTAQIGDKPLVTKLLEASYGKLLPALYGVEHTSKLLPVIARAKPELLASTTYYLATSSQGRIIGAGGWTRERPGTGNIEPGLGHVRHVATHPDWTGRGVGRALIGHIVGQAKTKGVARLECYASLNAVDFYARLGFVELRPIDIPVGSEVIMPSLLMERIL